MKRNWLILLFCIVCNVAQCATTLKEQLHALVAPYRAEVGVAVIVDGKNTIAVNNEVKYPMMSVFKFHQALAVADCLQRHKTSLDSVLFIPKSEFKQDTYSPLRDKYPNQDIHISIRELLTYTLQLSDNNACDILFHHIIGVGDTDAYLRTLGVEDFAIVANEDDMHHDESLCYANWSSPLASAVLLDKLVSNDFLQGDYKEFIVRMMIECGTGKDRLVKPLLGTDAVCGHKTGTGVRNANGQIIGVNDIGFVLLPDGRRYAIAVYVKDSEETLDTSSKIIADVSEIVYQYLK